jgi:predicted phosphodiesterase
MREDCHVKHICAGLFLVLLVGAAAHASPEGRLLAPSQDTAALRFAVIGDWGSGLPATDRVAQKMCKWRRNHPFDLVVTTGDNIYPDGNPDDFEAKFFDPFACLLDDGVRFRAVLGNHDVLTENGAPEIEEPAFGMPKRNYVFKNSGVRFVMVNSNAIRPKWLRKKTTAGEGDDWTVVSFHHPVYSPGPHGSTPGFAEWMPDLFRKRGVDLVVNGHDHLYAVTKVIKGLRYVVTGGGGASPYECGEAWFVARCRERYHFLYVVVRDEELTIKAVPAKGPVFHSFTASGD